MITIDRLNELASVEGSFGNNDTSKALYDAADLIAQLEAQIKENSAHVAPDCANSLSGNHWWIVQKDGTRQCQSCNLTSAQRESKP